VEYNDANRIATVQTPQCPKTDIKKKTKKQKTKTKTKKEKKKEEERF
jgi:hypothetical protein